MANSAVVSLTFVLILLHTVTAHAVQQQSLVAFRNSTYSILERDLAKDPFQKVYEGIVNLATSQSLFMYMGVRILVHQTGSGNEPPEWILLDLVATRGTTTLALRNDNLYLVGFTNFVGQWYAFDKSQELIPGSIKLDGINGDYESVGGRKHLEQLPLNRASAIDAVHTLLQYDHTSNSVSMSDLKDALATMLVMICEASRFKTLSDIIENGWDSVCYMPSDIGDCLTSWSNVALQLLKGWPNNKFTKRVIHRFPKNLKTPEDFAGILHVLLCPDPQKITVQLVPIPRNVPPPAPAPLPLPLPPALMA